MNKDCILAKAGCLLYIKFSWQIFLINQQVPQLILIKPLPLCRLEVQAGELANKESSQRETGSLGAGSDCASTRGMAGSIISSYTLPDR